MRPLCQKLQRRGINGDGRTDRASLQDSSLCVRCVKSYSVVVLTGTDAPAVCVPTVRPYNGLLVKLGADYS